MGETILSIEGLHKSFKNKTIIENISFEVRKGEIMAILGAEWGRKIDYHSNYYGNHVS